MSVICTLYGRHEGAYSYNVHTETTVVNIMVVDIHVQAFTSDNPASVLGTCSVGRKHPSIHMSTLKHAELIATFATCMYMYMYTSEKLVQNTCSSIVLRILV